MPAVSRLCAYSVYVTASIIDIDEYAMCAQDARCRKTDDSMPNDGTFTDISGKRAAAARAPRGERTK